MSAATHGATEAPVISNHFRPLRLAADKNVRTPGPPAESSQHGKILPNLDAKEKSGKTFCAFCSIAQAFRKTKTGVRSLGRPAAWLRGLGWASDTYWREPEALVALAPLRAAAQRAYAMAGIGAPTREIAVAEISDITPYHELMAYEALGFCEPGGGQRLLDDPGLAVNPSGGMLSANPYFASGLVRVAEAALQVMGRAGERQVKGATVALAHAVSGLGGQAHTVAVVGAER